MRLLLVGAIALAAAGVTAVSLIGRLGVGLWPLDLLANFRVQYTALLAVAALALLVLRSLPVAAAVGLVALVHVASLSHLVIGGGPAAAGTGAPLRVVQFNVLTSNDRVPEAAAWLADQDADVIVAQETDLAWAIGLTDGLDGWEPLPTDTVRSDNFGLMVFVRDGLAVASVEVTDRDIPAIAVELGVAGSPTTLVYAVHTLPPTSPDQVEVADEQLDRAAATVTAHDGPSLVVGDLNATRWSGSYRRLIDATELRNSADGRGLGGTWPAPLWFTGMIGIDHVLVSDEVAVTGWRTGPSLGSDHLPVVVDLVVPRGP